MLLETTMINAPRFVGFVVNLFVRFFDHEGEEVEESADSIKEAQEIIEGFGDGVIGWRLVAFTESGKEFPLGDFFMTETAHFVLSGLLGKPVDSTLVGHKYYLEER